MTARFSTNPHAVSGLKLIKVSSGTCFERMHLTIDMRAGGQATLKGKIKVFNTLKRAKYCAALYSARPPFKPEIGMPQAGSISNVSRRDRRWLMASGDLSGGYPRSFGLALLRNSGNFEITFHEALLNENYYESVIVIGRSDYMRSNLRKSRCFRNIKGLDAPETFNAYLEFLKTNRAYLTDFAFQSLIGNPNILLSTYLADKCSFDFK